MYVFNKIMYILNIVMFCAVIPLSAMLYLSSALGAVWGYDELKCVYPVASRYFQVGFWIGVAGLVTYLVIKRNRYILATVSIIVSVIIIIGLLMLNSPVLSTIAAIVLFLLGCTTLILSILEDRKVKKLMNRNNLGD
mgnify:CR=1 FL=1